MSCLNRGNGFQSERTGINLRKRIVLFEGKNYNPRERILFSKSSLREPITNLWELITYPSEPITNPSEQFPNSSDRITNQSERITYARKRNNTPLERITNL